MTLDGAPDQPMQLDVAPDGDVFYISRSGKVNVIHSHEGEAPETHVAGVLNVYDAGTAEINRVTRFTVNADDTLDMASAETVIEVPAFRGSDEEEPGHTGGYLHFGPGGNLYVGVGARPPTPTTCAARSCASTPRRPAATRSPRATCSRPAPR
ncbi:PQQ-dependent sugar dehydrogenase [Streptomyces wedmorensis]|uniref:PQQ-dependent sugar dehydrogenase n=1 Tax=Streptomyces wedmorensis TaxID=43759 RepID=UPI000A9A9B3B|nr:PQQ-dependent sugar dehydrogenase [Streptomyces wedmorensis]